MTASSSNIAAGCGLIHAKLLPPSKLSLAALNYKYPLKLVSPAPSRSTKCLVVFMLSYGGGLVSGDSVDLKVIVDEGAKLCIQTQGSTKVFKHVPPAPTTTQYINATLHANSSIILLPDPVQPFGESAYSQKQIFRLKSPATTSLLVLDWVTEGRAARGEKWNLTKYESRTELWDISAQSDEEATGRLILRDAIILEGDTDETSQNISSTSENNNQESLHERQDHQTVFATLVIKGPKFASLEKYVQDKWKKEPRIGAKRWDTDDDYEIVDDFTAAAAVEAKAYGVMWTMSAVRGCLLVKVSGRDVEAVKNFIRLLVLEGGVSIDENGEGCVERDFGSPCLRCIE